ncbi:hypothetical protein QBC37DRAFT_313080 [Rhypophila decipiens]|uniref:Uncharacterized protein n=1 Tax=Rhypophila decipiens TaxID=261697 RepID=A0AAN7BBN6_9PEZI|nr:hypothetical protein QBC37DRAFT_313080 [Rhypophila decipiens]
MKFTTAVLAGCGLASASVVPNDRPVLGRTSLFKRTEWDVCSNNCELRDVPMPDKNNFGLPLEGYWSEQCPPLIIGDYDAPLATSRACLDFQGTNLYFNFSSFPGYTLSAASVAWKVKGVVGQPSTWTSPPPTNDITCDAPSTPGGQYICKLSFADILNVPSSTSLLDLLAGICPLTDREALIFYLELSGTAVPVGGGDAVTFTQQYPCTQRTNDRQCTAWNPEFPYIEVAYRCSKCEVAACPPPPSSTSSSSSSTVTTTPPPSSTSAASSTSTTTTTTTSAPPTLKTCSLGTAFGYQNPVGGVSRSTTLNTLSGQGCNRWGWYESPTVAELQGGISGPLYVGAGGNDISKAIDVGIWVATANAQGKVTVTYLLNPPYALAEVHVNLVCKSAITKCAPGQYTYKAGSIPNLPTWSNPTPLTYPTCSGPVGLIMHAAVNILSATDTCPAPKAS